MIAYRRTVAEMPALEHEIAAVLQEGVRIEPLVVPVEVVKDAQGKPRRCACRTSNGSTKRW